MINILLAEDHHIVRNGISSLLDREPGQRISGEANNGAEVIQMLEENVPADIVIADINMPLLSGLELAERLQKDFPAIKVIILPAMDHEQYVVKAFKLGAQGYLLKNVRPDELLFAIKHISAGSKYICSELTTRFLDRLVHLPEPANTENIHGLDFTDREIDILRLVGDGFTNQEIADKIFTSKRTVEGLRQMLIDKTNSRNTAALIKFALVNGLIS